VSLVLNAVIGWWWADIAAGGILVFYGFREGREHLRPRVWPRRTELPFRAWPPRTERTHRTSRHAHRQARPIGTYALVGARQHRTPVRARSGAV